MGKIITVDKNIYPLVEEVTQSLTDAELNALHLSVQLGSDPISRPWYKKVEILFTQDDGKGMHELTMNAVNLVWEERNTSKLLLKLDKENEKK